MKFRDYIDIEQYSLTKEKKNAEYRRTEFSKESVQRAQLNLSIAEEEHRIINAHIEQLQQLLNRNKTNNQKKKN